MFVSQFEFHSSQLKPKFQVIENEGRTGIHPPRLRDRMADGLFSVQQLKSLIQHHTLKGVE